MSLNLILTIIILIALGVIVFIIIRKLPKLKMLDTETIPEEKVNKVRNKILTDRIKRKTEKGSKVLKQKAIPVFSWIGKFFKNIVKKVYELEQKYKKEANVKGKTSREVIKKAYNMIDDAEELVKQEQFSEAEKLFIEIISMDPKNIKAYKGLGDVYLELKEYKQAQQTFMYVLKLENSRSNVVEKVDKNTGERYEVYDNASRLADAYVDLGYVHQLMKEYEDAQRNYGKAIELEPNNPRNIDSLIEINIILKDKSAVYDLIARLESVNPENQKLKEYREKLNDM